MSEQAITPVEFAAQKVAVGRVFDRGFSTIRHNPLPALAIALLFAAIPFVAAHYVLDLLPWQYMVMTVGSIFLPGFFALAIARWFVGLVIGTLTLGAMTLPAIAESEGRRAGLGESLATAARALPALLILGVIFAVGVIFGTTLLIAPGVFVYILWSVAAPVATDERDGVFLALGRSQELGEGARWKTFAILLILMGISILVMGVTALVALLMFNMGWAVAQGSMPILVLQTVASAVMNLVWGAVLASLYVELKAWKEGGSPESLAGVFA